MGNDVEDQGGVMVVEGFKHIGEGQERLFCSLLDMHPTISYRNQTLMLDIY